jgi:hypothetical protein
MWMCLRSSLYSGELTLCALLLAHFRTNVSSYHGSLSLLDCYDGGLLKTYYSRFINTHHHAGNDIN